MGIVLITNNSDRGQALAHLIQRSGLNLKLVVVEDPGLVPGSQGLILHRIRAILGPTYRMLRAFLKLNSAQRAALRYEEESIKRAEAVVKRFIADLNVHGRPEGIDYLETPSLNEATVVTAISKLEPDLCVVMGTSIIKPRIIAIPKLGTINAHTSLLPEYRGSRSEFWQCYNQNYDHAGVTLHLIDKGVDTGSILFQQKQAVNGMPDPNMMRAENTKTVLLNYVSVIRSVLDGTARPQIQGPCTTPTYRFRDITEDKRIKLYSRILKSGTSSS
jgi:folate-dependent phosphoribosylglycinamide formyltransferase PurN